MLKSVRILGVLVHSGPASEVIAHIDDRVAQRSSTRVAFLNAHLSNLCSRNPAFQKELDGFLVLNDGVGLDIASWALHGAKFPHNLNGTDFVTSLLDRTRHDLRIFLLGTSNEVVSEAARRIEARWPRHKVVDHHHGFLDQSNEASLKDRLVQAKPDLILVGMGNLRQERWIARHVPDVCPCGVAVGAWLDFIAGAVPRAPAWVRAVRSEWVFRLCLEPRRLAGRFLVGNLVFLARLGRAKLRASATT
ncbi:WecB/TagA/CpsF family glycosyltransferase [uncultured Enterovirga sp.]|uniref:WecB/TagA/CpsF family glycosyltransferase n=1 Tax=uncultured Enterovirga sp. TaxID=2026352 RepID=UPI0035CA308B